MLLYTAVVALLAALLFSLWRMSQFLPDGAKSLQIFLLISVTGLCLVFNVVAPFAIVGSAITAFEARHLLFALLA